MVVPETPITPNDPPTTVGLLHDAYRAGLSLQQMAPFAGVTLHVAENYGLYTTTEPQDPGSFREYRKAQKLERILDSIADTAEGRFRDEPAFRDSFQDGTFPLALASAFDSILDIHGENVHLKNERTVDGRADGDIFIGKTIFTVEPGSAELLNTVLNKLLHKNIPKDKSLRASVHQPVVDASHPETVSVTNVSEHDIRAMGRAVDAVVWRWFRNQGLHLPPNKMSFSDWQEWGHTFPYPSEIVDFLDRGIIKYSETRATATYDQKYDEHNLRPVSQGRPLGTDSSGIYQRWRGIINGLGHHLRKGNSALNLEQNPNRYDRLSLEEGVDLRRPIITAEQAAYGPGSPEVLTSVELAAEALKRTIEEAKANKFGAAVKAARAALGLGLIDVGLATLSKLPGGLKLGRELSQDTAGYRAQQQAFKVGRKALEGIVWQEVMGPRFVELDALAQTEQA